MKITIVQQCMDCGMKFFSRIKNDDVGIFNISSEPCNICGSTVFKVYQKAVEIKENKMKNHKELYEHCFLERHYRGER